MSIQQDVFSIEWGGRTLSIETGSFAGQANGSVTVRYGDSVILATATMSAPRPGIGFFPLTVDFEERMYAGGKIPGSRYVRREGRPSEKSILTGRLIDRSIRPRFPKDALNDVQIVITTLVADGENDLDIPALIGASTALAISDIPFDGPIAGAKIGMVDGDFVVNPTHEQVENGALELVVASGREGILMIESGAQEVPEEEMAQAIEMAFRVVAPVLDLQDQIREKLGKPKKEMVTGSCPESLVEDIESKYGDKFQEAVATPIKGERNEALDALHVEAAEEFVSEEISGGQVEAAVEKLAKKYTRRMILEEGTRPDGRARDQLRELEARVDILPRTHGTGLFRRGGTQVLTITTLGSPGDVQIIDSLREGEETKRYIHHYNFPPYSVGDTRPMRGPGRREIGHGALAEKALVPVIPDGKDFPYTLRLVSEVLSSNGSTSMASVCGSTLSLLDAGVKLKAPVAGISIGLVLADDGSDRALLTDIIGMEDFYGDMDYKVAGTREGITAIQLDTKAHHLPVDMTREVFAAARQARMSILDLIEDTIGAPREELSEYAPRIIKVNIPVDRIGEVIGPGGKNVRGIVEETGAKVDIEEDGTVYITSASAEGGETAARMITDMVREVEIGEIYEGNITRILNFGAFVEILPGREGLIHIRNIEWGFIDNVEDVLHVGDVVNVKVVEIDDQGRINLSRKELLPKPEGYEERSHDDHSKGDRERGGRNDRRNGRGRRSHDRGGRH